MSDVYDTECGLYSDLDTTILVHVHVFIINKNSNYENMNGEWNNRQHSQKFEIVGWYFCCNH